MYGPVIQGKLVLLRPPRSEDAEAMIAWFEDMEVTRYIAVRNPPNLDFEKEWLDKMARDPNSVFWVIEHDGHAVAPKRRPGTRSSVAGARKRSWTASGSMRS